MTPVMSVTSDPVLKGDASYVSIVVLKPGKTMNYKDGMLETWDKRSNLCIPNSKQINKGVYKNKQMLNPKMR